MQLSSCIERHGDADSKEPIFVYRCGKLEPLQVAAQAGNLAIVRVEADQGQRFDVTQENDFMQHPNGGEAAFLLGKHGSGFCLIDQLLSWDWDQMGRIRNVTMKMRQRD